MPHSWVSAATSRSPRPYSGVPWVREPSSRTDREGWRSETSTTSAAYPVAPQPPVAVFASAPSPYGPRVPASGRSPTPSAPPGSPGSGGTPARRDPVSDSGPVSRGGPPSASGSRHSITSSGPTASTVPPARSPAPVPAEVPKSPASPWFPGIPRFAGFPRFPNVPNSSAPAHSAYSRRHSTPTSVPACTTALVTSSLTTTSASSHSRSVSDPAPGSARAVHAASVSRTKRRAAPGASAPPGSEVRATVRHPALPYAPTTDTPSSVGKVPSDAADAADGRAQVSRCVGMAPMDSSRSSRSNSPVPMRTE